MTVESDTLADTSLCIVGRPSYPSIGSRGRRGDTVAAMRGALALLLLLCSPCSTSTSHSEAISRGLSAPHNVTCAAGTYFNAQSMACESCLVGTAAEGSAVRTSCGKCKVCAVKNCLGRARKALETQCAVRHNLLNFLPSLSPPSTHFSTRPHALPVPSPTSLLQHECVVVGRALCGPARNVGVSSV